VITRDGTDITTYPSLWNALGIALIPIELSSFGLAKSYVKGLEACARGIPFIATRHPEYEELGAGLLAKRTWEWTAHLDALQDPEVYAQHAVTNRARAEALSITNNYQRWIDVFDEALRDR
jgi:hypothetical protein